MTASTFSQALAELYHGEILGEVIFDQMLSYFTEPELKHKIAVMLQLETETKARLRPAMIQLGLDIAEPAGARQLGLEIAESMDGKGWDETLAMLRDIVKPAVARYQEIADTAPAEHQALAEYMVKHEHSLLVFAELELAGDTEKSLAGITDQLQYKL